MFGLLLVLASGAVETPAAIPDKDPIICERRLAPNLGSRIGAKRICMRKSEWTYEGRRAQQQTQELQLKGQGHKFETPPAAGRP